LPNPPLPSRDPAVGVTPSLLPVAPSPCPSPVVLVAVEAVSPDALAPPVGSALSANTVAAGAHTKWLSVACARTVFTCTQNGALVSVQRMACWSSEHAGSARQAGTLADAMQRVAMLQLLLSSLEQHPNQLSAVLDWQDPWAQDMG